MQVRFYLKSVLKSLDKDIYENIRHSSLTQTVSEVWLILYIDFEVKSTVANQIKLDHITSEYMPLPVAGLLG